MALSSCFQTLIEDQTDPETVARTHMFREQTVQCLKLGEFTKGGEYTLETLLIYIILEILLCKDTQKGLWLVHGMVIQLAMSMGYHRDPQHISNISPFAGEMRRRVWATIVQTDLRLSSQMGLPRLIKLHLCDTAEPRNLLDTDFDEDTVELPPSRPETEFTPALFFLTKGRNDSIIDQVNDLLADPLDRPYADIMELDRKVQGMDSNLPAVFRWQPLSQSFMVPPQVVVQRIWSHLSQQRLIIWLHRKYLAPSYPEYEYSRKACVQAAITILEFQKLISEETQPGGLLYPVRFMTTTSVGQFIFLLGMSILSYYVQLAKTRPDLALDQETDARIHNLLRDSYPIWLQRSAASREAQKAVEHLSLLLGLRGQQEADTTPALGAANITSATTTGLSRDMAMPDQVTWDAYEGNRTP